MDLQQLRDAVEAEFAGTGADTPPWPDPRPRGEAPLEEEYSRCADPAKYRILRARSDAWVRALTALGVAVVEDGTGTGPGRALRLRPVRAAAGVHTLPLVLEFEAMDGVPDAVLHLAVGAPAVRVLTLPDCGCDACDTGSDDLLDVLDEHVRSVVTGDFVRVTARGGAVVAVGSGWSAEGALARCDVNGLLADVRAGRVRRGHRVERGDRWW